MKKIKYFLYGAIAILLGSNYIQCTQNTQASETLSMYETLKDELKKVTNELGQQESTISAFVATSTKAFTQLEAKHDTTVLELQKLVNKSKNIQTGIVHTVETSIRDTGTVKIVYVDSSRFSNEIPNFIRFPIINEKKDPFFSGVVKTWPYQSEWDITFQDTFLYKIDKFGTGLLNMGPPRYEITAINKNPYSDTKSLRSFSLTTPVKRFSIGPSVGYGAMVNDQGVNLGWFGGVVLTWSLLRF